MSILLVLRQRDAHVAPRALTRHGERDGGADTSRLEEVPDVVLRAYRLAIHGDDAIAQDHAARARQLRAGQPGLRGGGGERSSRPSALTTPVVREWSRPNGLPTA